MSQNKSILKRAFRPLEFMLMLGVLATFLVVLLEVVSRYIFHHSIAWGGEVCTTLLVWITFVGGAVALLDNGHMCVDLVMNRISSRGVKKFLGLIGSLAMLAFAVCGAFGGWKLAMRTWNMKTTTLQIPAGILYLAFPIGCVLIALVCLRRVFAALKAKGE